MDGRSELNDAMLGMATQREVKEVAPATTANAPGWDELGREAMEALRQVTPEQYQKELQAELDEHGHFSNITENQQIGLAQTVLEELAKVGLNSSAVSERTDVMDLDPWHMRGQDLLRILEWSRQNRPDVLVNMVLRWQNQPNVVASLLGNQGWSNLEAKLGAEKVADLPHAYT